MADHAYRAAIIGCGRIGTATGSGLGVSRIKSHAEAYATLPDVYLVALSDADAEALGDAATRWGVTATYDDYQRMLNAEALDILSVCVPPSLHEPVLSAAVRAGVRGVLMEKPLASDLASAQRAVEAVNGTEMKVAVDYIRRFPPVYRELVRDIGNGAIGDVQAVTGVYTKGIINNGSHMIDLLRAMFGEPIRCRAMSVDTAVGDPTVSALLTFPHDVEAWMARADAAAYNVFDVDIIGTEGRIVLSDLGHAVQRFVPDDTTSEFGFRQLGNPTEPQPTHLDQAIRYAVEDLITSVEKDRQPLCTAQDGYEALRIALELADAVRETNV